MRIPVENCVAVGDTLQFLLHQHLYIVKIKVSELPFGLFLLKFYHNVPITLLSIADVWNNYCKITNSLYVLVP